MNGYKKAPKQNKSSIQPNVHITIFTASANTHEEGENWILRMVALKSKSGAYYYKSVFVSKTILSVNNQEVRKKTSDRTTYRRKKTEQTKSCV